MLSKIITLIISFQTLFASSSTGNLQEVNALNVEERIVNGSSLSGVIENGEIVVIDFDYYKNHKPKRNDLIIYDYAGNKNPLIKIIKGVPGDSLGLQEKNRYYEILINQKVLQNSKGQNYALAANKAGMIQLYVDSYNGIIPEDAYLIMGNLPRGTTDSSRFGLIGKKDILGKVINIKR